MVDFWLFYWTNTEKSKKRAAYKQYIVYFAYLRNINIHHTFGHEPESLKTIQI